MLITLESARANSVNGMHEVHSRSTRHQWASKLPTSASGHGLKHHRFDLIPIHSYCVSDTTPRRKGRKHFSGPRVDRVLVNNTWWVVDCTIVFGDRDSNHLVRRLTCTGLQTGRGKHNPGWGLGKTMAYHQPPPPFP